MEVEKKDGEYASAPHPDPVEMLALLHEVGCGLSREIADVYMEEVYDNRVESESSPVTCIASAAAWAEAQAHWKL
jgi:hypothetical protein